MSAATTTSHTPWPTVKLGDVCALKNGYTPKAEELSEQGVIPYFRISAMNFEGNEKRMIKPTAWLVSKKRCFNAGSIVFPKNGGAVYTRKVRVLEHDSVVDLNTGVCTPDKKTIDCEYLYHWFSNLNITDVVVEGTIPFVDFGMLREVFIPLPPLDVQREIVAKVEAGLKEADGLVAHFKRLAALADDTFKAELDETFSTLNAPTVKLGDVCETCSGGTPLRTMREYYEDGDIPWLRSGEVCQKDIVQTEMFITQKGVDNSSAKKVPINTVVVAMYGATAGQVGILRIESTTNQAVCGILPSEKHLPEFLYYQLLSMKNVMVSQAQGGAQPNISQIKIKNLEIKFPSLDEQARIVARLEAAKARCERLKAESERGLKAAEALRKAVLAEAFEQ